MNRVIVDYCQDLNDYDAPWWWYDSVKVIEVPSSFVPRRTRISHNADDLEAITDALEAAGVSYSCILAADCYGKHLKRAGLEATAFYAGDSLALYIVASDSREVAVSVAAEYVRAWLDGEVYQYTLETLYRYYSAAGKIREEWEAVETMGDVYGLDTLTLENEAEDWGSREIVDPVAYELQDSHGAPQCGCETAYCEDLGRVEFLLESVEGLDERVRDGYAAVVPYEDAAA